MHSLNLQQGQTAIIEIDGENYFVQVSSDGKNQKIRKVPCQ
jgi:hypothetical protein